VTVESPFDGRRLARKLGTGPGVYVMRDGKGKALYVGKAANLRKRVASYFDARPKGERIMRMVAQVRDIEVGLTRTEGEALLLENEWIKSLRPRYNVLLRDDKSYPWIVLTTDHPFPRIAFHRGRRSRNRTYLGPYPSAGSVRESINLIQKTFRVRNCEDSYFAHRRRPCLQYQIKRCTAPCVGQVSATDYRAQVDDALLFLTGQSERLIGRLIERMEQAASEQRYEDAARLRDQINTLRKMHSQQFVSTRGGDIDVIALAVQSDKACLQVVSFRGGRNLGQRSHFPSHAAGHDEQTIMAAFLGQYYRERIPPRDLIISHEIPQRSLFAEVFSARAGRKVAIQPHPRAERRQWLELARRNAVHALQMSLSADARLETQFEALCRLLDLPEVPASLECFDISHTSGNETVGACVAFDHGGPVKSRYRRFNLKGITPGDDYAAIRQVLERRYRRLAAGEGDVPGLVVIDGGRGQLAQARAALEDYGLGDIRLLAVAKGPARRGGYEQWIADGGETTLQPGPESPASHLIQQVRDEAHRFAITGHRGRRQKAMVQSSLEEIPGVGAGRRRALLTHFGGMKGVRQAGVEELSGVPGISRELAQRIFDALH